MIQEVVEVKQSRYASFPCEAEGGMFTVKSGAVEVYACTPEGEQNYHRVFLMTCSSGESFFSPVDMGIPFELSVYALSDSVVEHESRKNPAIDGGIKRDKAILGAEGSSCLCRGIPGREAGVTQKAEFSSPKRTETTAFRYAASEWFYKLASLSWIRYLADIDDDTIARWTGKSIFAESTPESTDAGQQINERVIFLEHQKIFSTLVTGRFSVLERNYRIKLQKQAEQKERSMLGAMNDLLKTEYKFSSTFDSSEDTDDVIGFAIRRAAQRLGTETDMGKISLPSDMARRMNPITKMRRLVRKANMQIRMVTLSAEWYKSDMGIVLGYHRDANADDEDEHEFVALLPEDGHYVLVSPSHPFGLKIDHDVAARIQENAFLCYPCLPAQKLGVKELLRFMVRYIPSVDIHVIWAISLISGILALVMPLITENIFSDIIPINDRQALGTVTQVMLVSGLTTAILGVVRSIACLRIKVRIGMFVESTMWARLLSLPLRFFRQYQAGDIINRMQGVRAITTLLEDHMLTVIFNTLFSFISIGLMLYYSVKLTAVAFGVWIVYALMILPLYRRLGLLQQKKVQADNERSARTLQLLNGLTKFKLQGGEETAFRLWTQTFGNSWNWNLKMRWTTNYSEVINVIQPVILTMAVFYITSKTAVGQESQQLLGVAAFMGFQAAFSTFNATFVSFMSLLPSLYNIVPHVKNIMPILETEPEVTEDKLDAGVLSGEIDVRDLHFSYAPDAPMILKGLTFRIEAGESVAFVGPSGCGKSTLLRILLGMEQPTQGAVFYDGQDFSKLDVASVRSQMGVVLQNGQLMGGEIHTNIIGALPLTADDAWEAARLVGLDRDIKEMPMGMHTYISEGASNISGGQRQRILLARSLVNKPKIVVLDEATSALDNRTQAIVTESINKLGSTRIIVAHRLSTIRDVDRIFVLHDGQIAEEGNFEQLMEKNGLFAQLAQRQME